MRFIPVLLLVLAGCSSEGGNSDLFAPVDVLVDSWIGETKAVVVRKLGPDGVSSEGGRKMLFAIATKEFVDNLELPEASEAEGNEVDPSLIGFVMDSAKRACIMTLEFDGRGIVTDARANANCPLDQLPTPSSPDYTPP